jgi:hypothetical protein
MPMRYWPKLNSPPRGLSPYGMVPAGNGQGSWLVMGGALIVGLSGLVLAVVVG